MSLHDFLDEERELQWFYDNNKNNTGPTIGYRRVAGKVGLTKNEAGIRGSWVDKRVALFKTLGERSARIHILSKLTEETTGDGVTVSDDHEVYDTLYLEFGGTNLQFYGKDWDKTVEIVKRHKSKKKVFVCDDPDLSFLWELLPDEDWSLWTIAANAVNTDEVLRVLKAPEGVSCIHLPMDKGMQADDFNAGTIQKIVYIGRNQGRAVYFKMFNISPFLQIAGKVSEWEDYPNLTLVDIPQQKDRRAFYRNYYGCLAVYDKKHASTGWHTGRAYHALYAGVPVVAPPGNAGLDWTYPVNNAYDIETFVNLSEQERFEIWKKQLDKVTK
jgi:hypothetical protein